MDLIAIDVGSTRIRLCHWNGRAASARVMAVGHPRERWGEWLAAFGIEGPHEVVFRCIHPEWQIECGRAAVSEWAAAAGGRWLRFLKDSPISDPGLAAARYLANRTRWTSLVSVERDGELARVGLQDRRGRIDRFERVSACDFAFESALTDLVEELIQDYARNNDMSFGPGSKSVASRSQPGRGLICLGDGADGWGATIGAALNGVEALVPSNAETWPLLGMMIAPIELEFERPLGGRVLSVSELRAEFAELMDVACDAITREGYDLDDADCVRTVALVNSADERAELESLIWKAERAVGGSGVGGRAGANMGAEVEPIAVQSIHVQSIVHPPLPDWPIDIAPEMLY